MSIDIVAFARILSAPFIPGAGDGEALEDGDEDEGDGVADVEGDDQVDDAPEIARLEDAEVGE